jgi:hypothetical protein
MRSCTCRGETQTRDKKRNNKEEKEKEIKRRKKTSRRGGCCRRKELSYVHGWAKNRVDVILL